MISALFGEKPLHGEVDMLYSPTELQRARLTPSPDGDSLTV
jgi:hypothetical protein